MSAGSNIHWARVANDWTRTMLVLGRSNMPLSILQSAGTSVVNNVIQRWNTGNEDVNTLSGILRVANYAENVAKTGNCREHAAVAFAYLYNQGVSPIEYVSYASPGNHSFVVIGRASANPINFDPRTLDSAVAVCDPWDGRAISASQIPSSMYSGWENGFEVYYRHGG